MQLKVKSINTPQQPVPLNDSTPKRPDPEVPERNNGGDLPPNTSSGYSRSEIQGLQFGQTILVAGAVVER